MLAFCASGHASEDAGTKFLTDYERGENSQGDPVASGNRPALWENVDAVGARPDIETFGLSSPELGQLDIPSGIAANISGSLQSMFERLSQNEAFLEFYDRVREDGTNRDDVNYGHEGDLTDLESRGDELAEILQPEQ